MTIHLPADTALALAMALTDARYDLHAKRTAAEKAIEDLISFLDDTEGDPDLEETADEEPWLGWPVGGQRVTDDSDREQDNADCEDEGDFEASLGSLGAGDSYVEPMGFWRVKPKWMTDAEWATRLREEIYADRTQLSQSNWAGGKGNDLEDEHDGKEPDQEDGGSWSEAASMAGKTDGGSGEDHEPSLGMPEQMNQVTRVLKQNITLIEDGEEDSGDAPELVNEDGGDIQDEPHDALDEGNDEMSLGWGLQMDQRKAAAQAPFWGDEDCWQVA